MGESRKTPLFEEHRKLNAHLGEFAGWLLPIWYSGIQKEAVAARTGAGLFDTSHMGRIFVYGPDSQRFLQRLVTGNVLKLKPKQILYTFLCRDNGGIIDDLMVYKFGASLFLLVVNAGNKEKVLRWLNSQRNNYGVQIDDVTEIMAMMAVQGPKAEESLVGAGFPQDFIPQKYHTFSVFQKWFNRKGIPEIIISQTGYTGELGFEIFIPTNRAPELWQKFIENNLALPCGLGARDILRLEAGLPLYGHEIDENKNPLEAGLERFVDFRKKGNFIGKPALLNQKKELKRKLIGFELFSERIARPGQDISKNGKFIGEVASGTFSPNLKKSIGTGYVIKEFAGAETEIEIDVRGVKTKSKVVPLPFYKRKPKSPA